MNAKGVDVSHHQGDKIDWQQFRANGISFCFLRASVGLSADEMYQLNHTRAGEAGILRGSYHYLFSEADQKAQAQVFAQTLRQGELPPVVDVEQSGLTEGKVRTFIDEFEALTGQKLIIYTSQSKWHELVGRDTPWASDHDLWVANYRVSGEPLIPNAWNTWTFWQHTDQGRLPGYHSNLDLDYFSGDEAALRAYALGEKTMAHDLLQYICPPDGKKYRLFGLGDESCQCVQADDGWIEFRKNRHMEEFYVTDTVIGRGADTSEISRDGVHPTGQFYILYTRRPDGSLTYGAPWAKRLMRVGEEFHRDCRVIRYNADGSIVAQYDDATDLVLNAHHDSRTFAQFGITVKDVLELQWGGEEVYYYGKGYGLVGWENLRTGQGSFIGVVGATISDPFPHDVKPRPRVAHPPHDLAAVNLPDVDQPTYPQGRKPQEMKVNQPDGIWLLAMPGTSSHHIRVLPQGEEVTVYSTPVVPSGRYNWQRVTTKRKEKGWSAAVVDNIPSFVPVEEADTGEVHEAEHEETGPVAHPEGTNPQPMRVNQASGIWLLDNPGVGSGHIRVLPFREIVTVYEQPVVSAGDYDWQRVTTGRDENGWSAVVVDGTPSFVPVKPSTSGPFRLDYPVALPARISQRFGVNQTGIPDFYSRWGLPAHEGIDFGGRLGDPIYAAAAGRVLAIAIPGEGGVPLDHAYGKHIKLQHVVDDQTYETDYCHLSSVAPALAVGQPVTAGQRIGEMGNTGNVVAGAVHLHFMLRKEGATTAGEEQVLGDGTKAVYKNDIVDPAPYLG
jgi:GH25 family lysozyme M1 (1,4-beta-N-acetylmuramidase)/murein DD-endopeptidase MepM/ murein hydrolase activator NlpD